MRLLLSSNSANPGESYLAHAKNQLKDFLGEQKQNVIFIPYAVVTFSFDEYEKKVNDVFDEVVGLHKGIMLRCDENNNQITII
jgi:dipeptidase E